ncbi:hypothetical protein PRBEI_2001353100 [Prionailurus iriomotensis]
MRTDGTSRSSPSSARPAQPGRSSASPAPVRRPPAEEQQSAVSLRSWGPLTQPNRPRALCRKYFLKSLVGHSTIAKCLVHLRSLTAGEALYKRCYLESEN